MEFYIGITTLTWRLFPGKMPTNIHHRLQVDLVAKWSTSTINTSPTMFIRKKGCTVLVEHCTRLERWSYCGCAFILWFSASFGCVSAVAARIEFVVVMIKVIIIHHRCNRRWILHIKRPTTVAKRWPLTPRTMHNFHSLFTILIRLSARFFYQALSGDFLYIFYTLHVCKILLHLQEYLLKLFAVLL